MTYVREGGLLLCECKHPLAYHPALPAWYGAKHSEGPRCSFCECREPKRGEDQRLLLEQQKGEGDY